MARNNNMATVDPNSTNGSTNNTPPGQQAKLTSSQSSEAALLAQTAAIVSGQNRGTAVPASNPTGATSSPATGSAQKKKFCPNARQNIMEYYASYNYLFTMAAVSMGEFNAGTWRKDTYSDVIFSSAGRYSGQRVKTAHGKPEYFVENFEQTNVIAPNPKIGNTYAIKYKFEIYEPYSMGVFLQSLAIASWKQGYNSHLECPFVFKLEFEGFTNDGYLAGNVCDPRWFCMRLTKANFTVSEGGSRYEIEGVPYNHFSYSNTTDSVFSDIKIEIENGKTVKDALVNAENSLQNALNRVMTDQKETGRQSCNAEKTEYLIEFPIPGSDADTNDIGNAKFDCKLWHGGARPHGKAENVYDGNTQQNKADYTAIDHDRREIRFSQGDSIVSVITKVINQSEWVFTEATAKTDTNNGFRTHFKVDVQEELLGYDDRTQVLRKKVKFRVRPYGVHEAMYKNPKSRPIGYEFIKSQIVKEYHYTYTGQNVDILNFDIEINNMFYQGINPKTETNNEGWQNQGQHVTAEVDPNKIVAGDGPSAKARTNVTPVAETQMDPSYLHQNERMGSNLQKYETLIAENFHRQFVESTAADMIMLDLEVLGDPYWLSDSGPCNYTVSEPAPKQEVGESTDPIMNYENSDIFVYVVFRAPIDADIPGGIFSFPEKNSYGGIYRVTTVESTFADGNFRQRLKGVRMVGQSLEYESAPPSPGNTKVVEDTGVHQERTEPGQKWKNC